MKNINDSVKAANQVTSGIKLVLLIDHATYADKKFFIEYPTG